jgi:shikimate kinase
MESLGNIYLIGLMGAGKTTVGKQLAKALKRSFYDSDKAIEESTGVDIATIFEFEGEKGFRLREQKMIQLLTERQGIVMATGGGSILMEENRSCLNETGFVVYLQCSVEKILQRTRKDTKRPLLQTKNRRQKIEQLLLERNDFYQECADFTINTGRLPNKIVINNILNALQPKKNNHE